MKNTYGVMVYQEQLMAAVRALAGFTLAEADVMRKAVGKKIKSLMDEQEGKFKDGCATAGTPTTVADKFWELVEPFNRYAFNRSHAACYAMVAYQTAYLKANYPNEFMASFMNSETGDIERVAFLLQGVVERLDLFDIAIPCGSLERCVSSFGRATASEGVRDQERPGDHGMALTEWG